MRILLAAGSNAKGQLGIGSQDDAHTFTPCQFAGYAPNQLPGPTPTIVHVAGGANHTVLLLRHIDGLTTLWGAGDGQRGQLGVGYTRGEPEPAPCSDVPWTIFHRLDLDLALTPDSETYAARGYRYKDVAAAWETTYVVLACPGHSDVLLSMGSNAFGALGVGDSEESSEGTVGGPSGAPRVVDFGHVFPERRGTMWVRSLHAGPRHVIAQLVMHADADANGSHIQTVLVGWGASRHGQLGQNGGTRFVAQPTRLPIPIDDDPMVSCALGNQHTVVVHTSGRISALGSNKQGQIPLLGSPTRICKLGCTWNGTYVLTSHGERRVLLSMGNNAQGQLGRNQTVESTPTADGTVDLPDDRALSNFVCGSEHVLAVISGSSQEGNSVVGWGWNEHGNMGLGSLGNVTVPTQLWPKDDVDAYKKYSQRVIDIWAGCATSWLLVE